MGYDYETAFHDHFSITSKGLPAKPGCWNEVIVSVEKNGVALGQYIRSYPTLFRSFHPFKIEGKYYALLSSDYTKATLYDLETFTELSSTASGFCPTGFFVPQLDDWDYEHVLRPTYAIAIGCFWGDEHTWKIKKIDLTDLTNIHYDENWVLDYTDLGSGNSALGS